MDCIDVVQSLSQKEQNSILSVLQRDEHLRLGQDKKISELKKEIQKLRTFSILKAGDDQAKMCLRCRAEFGFLFNRGTLCPICRFKVCNQCQQVMFNGTWLCIMCYKQRQLKWLTGEWATFEQNPMRKWASGSDLIRASMKLSIGGTTSIDLDEQPTENVNANNNKTRKPARNAVSAPDQGKARGVEYPKEGDQLKLSQLFGVLRTKKPEEVEKEHQVKRVSSRRYSESDSDSSSSSDVEEVASSIRNTESPNASSLTESEIDARGIDSPRGIEVGLGHLSNRTGESSKKLVPSNKANFRPKAAPRSPQPATRSHMVNTSTDDPNQVVRPKARPRNDDRKSMPLGHNTDRDFSRVEDDGKVSVSKSVDVNLGGDLQQDLDKHRKAVSHTELNLQRHVARTKESLDKKKYQETKMSKSQNSLDNISRKKAEPQTENVEVQVHREQVLREQVLRRSADDLLETVSSNGVGAAAKHIRKSDNYLDKDIHKGRNGGILNKRVKSKDSILTESQQVTGVDHISNSNISVIIDQSDPDANENQKETDNSDCVSLDASRPQSKFIMPNKIEDQMNENFIIPTQRAGSPYSFSMDSLPSSHPSPTFHNSSVSESSLQESSDCDSLSRFSHPEQGEFSGTESVAREGSGEDFDVEEISKVRFQRISRKIAQVGAMAKITRSPRRKLPNSRDSPQTISECSISKDDSGHVSGGSRGTTPEHKRTDSNLSQSSIPSTMSTVTDKSEEDDDIDKVIATMHTQYISGSRGNLLSTIADSRESIASYYSDAGDIAYSNIPVTGEILFSVNYNYKTSMLEVAVKQCRDIAVADTRRHKTDPYVKTYLLPDKTRSGKRKTKVKKHTTSPTFDETLRYSISKSELENRTLWVTVWHNDRLGRNSFLGEVTINFDYYKFDDPSSKWYPLQERIDTTPSSMMVYKGDLSVCIRYVPADKVNTSPSHKGKQKKESGKGQLQVMVKEARNLTAVRSNGFSDPFCKGYLLPERHKSSKQKTVVVKKDCNPVWNHTFIFEDVTLMELRERCLELTIWDYEKISSNDFLGGVRLNLGTGVSQGKPIDWMDARGEEMSMWQAMLDRSNCWIDGALILRPNMEKRKY